MAEKAQISCTLEQQANFSPSINMKNSSTTAKAECAYAPENMRQGIQSIFGTRKGTWWMMLLDYKLGFGCRIDIWVVLKDYIFLIC
jgi:hypothetical protein